MAFGHRVTVPAQSSGVCLQGQGACCRQCCVDDGSFALGKINLFLDQTVGVRPGEAFYLLDLWRLPGRS